MMFKSLFSGENRKKVLIFGAAAVMILLLLSTVTGGSGKSSRDTTPVLSVTEDASKLEQSLEQRLVKLLEKMDGVGSVSVMVTLDTSSRQLYEKDEKTNQKTASDSGGAESSAHETETVLAGSSKEPLSAGVVQPKVRGAAVVCNGASDPVIREKVTYAVAKALNIGVSRVYVTY